MKPVLLFVLYMVCAGTFVFICLHSPTEVSLVVIFFIYFDKGMLIIFHHKIPLVFAKYTGYDEDDESYET